MAERDDQQPRPGGPPGGRERDGAERRIHQGEPTYDPADISEGARRSRWREDQHADGTAPTGLPGGESGEA